MRYVMAFSCVALVAGDPSGNEFAKEVYKMNDFILRSHPINGVFQPSVDARTEMLRYFNCKESSRLKKMLKRNGIVNSSAVIDVADMASLQLQKNEAFNFADLIKYGLNRQKMYQHPVLHDVPPPPPM